MSIRNWFLSCAGVITLALGGVTPSYAATETTPMRVSLLDAVQHYENGDFASSYRYLYELMQLGNGQASAQLGMMTLAEEGTSYDPVLAWAYFTLADKMDYPDGSQFAAEVYSQLDSDQQQATSGVLAELESQLIITQHRIAAYSHSGEKQRSVLTALERKAPRYPRRSVQRGHVGFVQMLLLVDTDGTVAAVHSYFYSEPAFKREAERAVRDWTYEPPSSPTITHVRLDFNISRVDVDERDPYLKAIADSLWDDALAGNPYVQMAQAVFLGFVSSSAQNEHADPTLLANRPPSIQEFENFAAQEVFPIDWTSNYWLIRAAQSGEPTAQFALSHQHSEWRDYLISKNDENVMAWVLADLINQPTELQPIELLTRLEGSESEHVQRILAVVKPYYNLES